MADDITLSLGTGDGAVLATDEVSSKHYQWTKLVFGGDDVISKVDTSTPLPVDLRTDNLTGNLDINIAASAITLTVDSELPVAGVLGDATANPTVPAVGSFPHGFNGTNWDRLRIDGADNLNVNVNAAIAAGDNNIGNVDIVSLPDEGQQNMASSISVAIASDQSAVDVAVASALPAGDNNVGNVDIVTLPATTLAAGNLVHVDYDTGGGTENMPMVGMALPGAGGSVAGGTATNPVRTDPTGTTTQPVSGTVTANAGTGTMTVDTEMPAAGALGDAIANPTTPLLGNAVLGFNGTTWDRLRSDTTNGLDVDVTRVSGSVTVVGDVAHDGADSGNPVKTGGVSRQTLPAAVADGDRVNSFMDDLGRMVGYPIAPRDRIVHNRIVLTDQTETTLIATGGAGVLRDLVDLTISNESATEVRVDIRDATGGTIRFSIDLAADGGGISKTFRVPLTQATADNNWTAQLSANATSVYLTAVAVDQN